MKSALTHFPASLTAAALPLALLLLATGAALLPAGPAEAVRHALGAICHQLPDRSFTLDGASFGVCHRCTGLYLGLAIGAVWGGRRPISRWIVVFSAVPMIVDWGVAVVGLWDGSAYSRIGTGLLLGIVLGCSVVSVWRNPSGRAPEHVPILSSR